MKSSNYANYGLEESAIKAILSAIDDKPIKVQRDAIVEAARKWLAATDEDCSNVDMFSLILVDFFGKDFDSRAGHFLCFDQGVVAYIKALELVKGTNDINLSPEGFKRLSNTIPSKWMLPIITAIVAAKIGEEVPRHNRGIRVVENRIYIESGGLFLSIDIKGELHEWVLMLNAISKELELQNKAVIMEERCGNRWWCFRGKLHKLGGPAVEYANGDKYWYFEDKLHRPDGAAVERADGHKEWWYYGEQIRCSSTNEFVCVRKILDEYLVKFESTGKDDAITADMYPIEKRQE